MIINQLRRRLLCASTASAAALMLPAISFAKPAQRLKKAKAAKVVVVGGGFAGATCAKYLRMWSEQAIDVTLVEPNSNYFSCPMSNLVVSDLRDIASISFGYNDLQQNWGVRLIHDSVSAIDSQAKSIKLAGGSKLSYDRLVLAPGIDFMLDELPGLAAADAFTQIPHAWKAGTQTTLLKQQLAAMPENGVFAIAIPKMPYRCPPGPYERACLVANYFKKHKAKAKILILDANDKIQSKEVLFKKAFAELYADIIDYLPNSTLMDVDVANKTAQLEFDTVKADVLNVIPPQSAGKLATNSGLKLINGRWVDVNWSSMEASNMPNVHVLGDALFPAPMMPKSAHMANQQAKLAAAAIINLLSDQAPNPAPVLTNTCFSFVNENNAIHVTTVLQYDPGSKSYLPNPHSSGGISAAPSTQEAKIARDWARNIWADSLS